jgi:predicted TIM-barrel fold metal-dependent hydrolase
MIKAPLYDFEAFWAECRFSGVTAAVHVEADVRSADPLAEVKWLRELANPTPLSLRVVARATLASPEIEHHLSELGNFPEVRGIRDFGAVHYFRDPHNHRGFETGVRLLAEAGYLLDLDCAWEEMAAAKRLADDHGDLPIVLEHFGYPRSRDAEYFQHWNGPLRELAQAENTYCKLSGFGMTDRTWSDESLRPWLETCVEAFGPSRCLFGSNWPVDRIASSYDSFVASFLRMIARYSPDEQQAICSGTAAALYQL